MNRLAPALDRWKVSKPWRAWERYGAVRGNVLAGGIAYFALFSLFPALALGFTIFGLVVDGDVELQRRVADAVNHTFGTVLIGTEPGTGVATVESLVRTDVLTVWGLAGLVVLVFSGLGWIGALRDGVSAVFGRREDPNLVAAKAADLGVLAVFGLSVLASAVGSVLVTATTGPVLDWLGLGRSRLAGVLVSVLSALLLLVMDTLLFVMLFRVLSGVRPAVDDVFTGALAGGVGLGLLKLGGGVLLRLASGNGFLAAFSIVVALLLWMNLAARLTLLAAAWAATTVADRAGAATPEPAGELAAPAAAVPTYSARAADRTTLLAGAVLGATAAVGARIVGRAGRSLWGGSRTPAELTGAGLTRERGAATGRRRRP